MFVLLCVLLSLPNREYPQFWTKVIRITIRTESTDQLLQALDEDGAHCGHCLKIDELIRRGRDPAVLAALIKTAADTAHPERSANATYILFRLGDDASARMGSLVERLPLEISSNIDLRAIFAVLLGPGDYQYSSQVEELLGSDNPEVVQIAKAAIAHMNGLEYEFEWPEPEYPSSASGRERLRNPGAG